MHVTFHRTHDNLMAAPLLTISGWLKNDEMRMNFDPPRPLQVTKDPTRVQDADRFIALFDQDLPSAWHLSDKIFEIEPMVIDTIDAVRVATLMTTHPDGLPDVDDDAERTVDASARNAA